MEIKVIELKATDEETISAVFIDNKFICYSLEDEQRDEKIHGETRIDGNIYNVTLRTEGGFHARYLKKVGPDFHRGMLHVREVPKFKWVLIHIGNDDDDTMGCLLVGMDHNNKDFISSSRIAYEKFYPIVASALVKGENVTIEYIRS